MSARSSRHRVERQRVRWRLNRTSLVHRRDAQPFHRGDSFRATPSSCPSCQTLGVTRNLAVNLMHRGATRRPSRPVVRCLSALSASQARARRALRSRPARSAIFAVATVIGSSAKQATRGFRNLRGKAFPAQLASALARRRGQMLVSLWALPLSEGRRSLGGTVSSGSGVGGVQTVPRLSTSLTPNPSIKRTVKGLRPSPAAYVKR